MSNSHTGVAPSHIGVDLLGSDLPPTELLNAVLSGSYKLHNSTHLVLFGPRSLFQSLSPPALNIIFHPTEEIITMNDAPLSAIRKKRHSSLCTGIRLLKEGRIQAFISAGNTGALLACSAIELPSLCDIKRPALMAQLPTKEAEMTVLDVGANTHCQAHHLIQFALMGVAYQKSRGAMMPRVGLLNIGSEALKGTPELQQAYHRLQQISQNKTSFCFVGNIEGRDAFSGGVDVLVTDGFTGNVFLKTAEGIATHILDELELHSPSSSDLFSKIRTRLHYAEHPGAILVGIEGIVLKCHGSLSSQSISKTLITAESLVHNQFLDQIKQELSFLKNKDL